MMPHSPGHAAALTVTPSTGSIVLFEIVGDNVVVGAVRYQREEDYRHSRDCDRNLADQGASCRRGGTVTALQSRVIRRYSSLPISSPTIIDPMTSTDATVFTILAVIPVILTLRSWAGVRLARRAEQASASVTAEENAPPRRPRFRGEATSTACCRGACRWAPGRQGCTATTGR